MRCYRFRLFTNFVAHWASRNLIFDRKEKQNVFIYLSYFYFLLCHQLVFITLEN